MTEVLVSNAFWLFAESVCYLRIGELKARNEDVELKLATPFTSTYWYKFVHMLPPQTKQMNYAAALL